MTDAFSDLKGIIRKSGMTHAQIAHQAGVTAQTIENWLSGRVREGNPDCVAAVAAVFGRRLELRLVPKFDTAESVAAKARTARGVGVSMAEWLRQ